jgi:DNA repair exonuclease SbcCD nuclease subunit
MRKGLQSMRIAAVGDAHIGSEGFSELRSWDFLRQFDRAISRAVESGADCIVILGDLFDRTIEAGGIRWLETCIAEVAHSLERPRRRGVPVLAIPGNNDRKSCFSYQGLQELTDEGYLAILDDAAVLVGDVWLCGVSWKASGEAFSEAVDRLAFQVAKERALLCIHQLVSGSAYISDKELAIGQRSVSGWKAVFAGHNHIHQEYGNIHIPGSLEIRNLIDVIAGEEKGILLYDTETGSAGFIAIPLSRAVHYFKCDVTGRPPVEVYREIRGWINRMSSEGTLLLINLRGTLTPESRMRIPFEELERSGLKKGCIVTFLDRLSSETLP